MEVLIFGVIFALGLCLGSFANVCIYRIPRDLSVVSPPSACTSCKSFIKWHDNLPVISYLFLKGRCRACGKKISAVYPAFEIITALTFCLLFAFYGFSAEFFGLSFLAFILIVISGIDSHFQIIPDVFSLGLIITGVIFSPFNAMLGESVLSRILGSGIGIIAGGGFLLAMGIIGKIVFKKDAMGGGDVKLMAGVGAFIGFDRVLVAMFIASFIASIIGIYLIISKKIEQKGYIPFGPYLAAGSLVTVFLPAPIVIFNYIINAETVLLGRLF